MKNELHPYLRFGIFSMKILLIMWGVFILYDLCIDENRMFNSTEIRDWAGLLVLIVLLVFPIAAYFKKRRDYMTDKHIIDCLIHILIWAAEASVISYPIFYMVDMRTWIIPQNHSRGGFIDLNGIEYIFPPIIMGIVAAVMIVFSLLPEIVKKIISKNKAER